MKLQDFEDDYILGPLAGKKDNGSQMGYLFLAAYGLQMKNIY